MGRVVPEYHASQIREIIIRSYRIIYRIDHEKKLVEIARVWHAGRGTPELAETS
jgi:plasmid stabilization system protein ParE